MSGGSSQKSAIRHQRSELAVSARLRIQQRSRHGHDSPDQQANHDEQADNIEQTDTAGAGKLEVHEG